MSETSQAQLWLRACSLLVADDSGNGVELAGQDLNNTLRIRFTVISASTSSAVSLHARIYNLSADTIKRLISLASKQAPNIAGVPFATSARVVLRAGYVSNLGQLFHGQIYQMRAGKETNVDSYLDIFAGDGDYAKGWSTANTTFAKGYTSEQVWDYFGQQMTPWQVDPGDKPDSLSTTPSVRGRVEFGMTRDRLDQLGKSDNFWWNIDGGILNGYQRFTARPGTAIVINSGTGQIGVPEQTEEGITVTCLLNPAIRWGTRIQLNNTEISQFLQNQPGLGANLQGATSPNISRSGSQVIVPPLNTDGIYICMQVRHVGDTRGNEWYSHIVAINGDKNAVLPSATAPIPGR